MREGGVAYQEDSVAGLLATPERLASMAAWCAEAVLRQLVREGYRPERYSRAAVVSRAERDVACDWEGDARCGFAHTPEQAASYRQQYIAAFLARWYDEALRAELRASASRGCLIVCMR